MGPGSRRLASGPPDSRRCDGRARPLRGAGGKTMQLAAAGHSVTAVDSSESRLGRLRENLHRTHLDATLVEADALDWQAAQEVRRNSARRAMLGNRHLSPASRGPLPRAPASHRRERRAPAQLLERAVGWLKPGGSIVYSVCSLEPQEGEEVIADFLAGEFDVESHPSGLPEFARLATDAASWSASSPACSKPKAGSTASSSRGLSGAVNPV